MIGTAGLKFRKEYGTHTHTLVCLPEKVNIDKLCGNKKPSKIQIKQCKLNSKRQAYFMKLHSKRSDALRFTRARLSIKDGIKTEPGY